MRPTDTQKIYELPIPCVVRIHLTEWKKFSDSLRAYTFKNGVTDPIEIATEFDRVQLWRFALVTGQVHLEILDVSSSDHDDEAEAIFGNTKDDDTAVLPKRASIPTGGTAGGSYDSASSTDRSDVVDPRPATGTESKKPVSSKSKRG